MRTTVQLLALLAAFSKAVSEPGSRQAQASAEVVADGSLSVEELLLLPEVPSKLDFKPRPQFADDDDFSAQLELRDSRFWGRLYVEGWPQPIQYMRAHFGEPPPMGRLPIVLANPANACSPINPANTVNAIVLAVRGDCPYGVKSSAALQANASALVIVNNEDGIHHIAAPDVHDIELSVSMIGKDDGDLLREVLGEQALFGYMVPINCAKQSNRGGDQLCDATTAIERRVITSMNTGGLIVDRQGSLSTQSLEYLLSTFGVSVPPSPLHTAVAAPADACDALVNKDEVTGKAVFVRRGSCPFVQKALHVQEAGGKAVIFVNNDAVLSRVGVEPRWKGYDVRIPVVLTSQRAFESVAPGAEILLTPQQAVSAAVWQEIEQLRSPTSWPRSAEARQSTYKQLLEKHSPWPDRVAAIESIYLSLQS